MWCWRLVHMPLHKPRTWIQLSKRSNTLKLCENFTKSSLCSNYHYLTPLSNLCILALAPGFSLSALSCQNKCSVSSSIFIPCSLCLHHWHPSHCLFAVPILLVHLCSLSSVWSQFFLLSSSLLPSSLFWSLLAPCPTSPCFLAPAWFLAPPSGSFWPPFWFSLPSLFWSKVRDAKECGEEWMGKEDEGSRGMGCNGLYLCLSSSTL